MSAAYEHVRSSAWQVSWPRVGRRNGAGRWSELGAPWVVTLGDSAISGEAGRWAGNSNVSPSYIDTGANAYPTTPPAPARRSPDAIARRRPRRTSEAGSARSTWRARAPARTRRREATSSPVSTGTTTVDTSQPGRRARRLRPHAQRRGRDGADRRQQLRLRRHRATVRGQLADFARRGGRTTATTTRRSPIASRTPPSRRARTRSSDSLATSPRR